MTRPFLPVLALCACLAAGSTLAASSSADADLPSLNYDPDTGAFTEAPPPERGWQAFADLLKKATPSVNTAIPLTPAQIAEHVSSLIDSGRAKEALDIITKRQAAHDASVSPGVDVQLRYLQGRALDALGQHDQAMAVWRQMTIDYPELPEPWNALAIAAWPSYLKAVAVWLRQVSVSSRMYRPAVCLLMSVRTSAGMRV